MHESPPSATEEHDVTEAGASWLSISKIGAIFAVVIALWLLGGWITWQWGVARHSLDPTGPIEPGTIGDLYGATNALFAGLAFAGVIVALILQTEELREARKLRTHDLKEQKAIAKAQREVAASQVLVARSGDALRSWEFLHNPEVTEAISGLTGLHQVLWQLRLDDACQHVASLLHILDGDRPRPDISRAIQAGPTEYFNGTGGGSMFRATLAADHLDKAMRAILGVRTTLQAGIYTVDHLSAAVQPEVCRLIAHHCRGHHGKIAVANLLDDIAGMLETHELSLITDAHFESQRRAAIQQAARFYSGARLSHYNQWREWMLTSS